MIPIASSISGKIFNMKADFIRRVRQSWRKARAQRDRQRLALAKRLLRRRRDGGPFNPNEISNIGLFQWDDKLGDTLMATRFVNAVKTARPEIELTFITGPIGEAMLRDFSAIDNIEVCRRKDWVTAGRLGKIDKDFDLVMDLTTNMSAVRLFALKRLNAFHYMGYEQHDHEFFDVQVAKEARHFADRYLAAAEAIVGPVSAPAYFLPESESATATVERFLADIPANRTRVLINLFAGGKHRSFSSNEAEVLLRWWLNLRPDCFLMLLSVPGKGKELDELTRRIGSADACPTPTPPSVDLTVALTRAADVVFSPDTATVHIAAALEKPLIAVFTAKERNLAEWGPHYPAARIVLTQPSQNRYDEVGINTFSRDQLRQAIDDLLPVAVEQRSSMN